MREFHEAATTIQRVVRGHLVRQRVARMHACATAVQRVFRGHRARTAYTALVAQARTEHARTAALLRIRRRAAARETALAHLRATHRSKVAAAADARAHAAATRLQAWFRAVRVRARLLAALRRRRRSSCSRDGATDDAESAGDRSATVAEADVCAARERVIERLFSDAQRRSAATAAAPITAPASASASAAALLASLRKCQKLLDAYYDAADDDDFEQHPSQAAAVLKFSPDDVSLGCRSLRVRTESYLKVLLECGDTLDTPNDAFVSLTIAQPASVLRQKHLRALQDGRTRWWEFELAGAGDEAIKDLMDLSAEDAACSTRTL